MIKTFADKRTAALFAGQFVKALPTDVALRAKRKLDLIDAAAALEFLRSLQGTGWRRLLATGRVSTASA